MQVRFASSHVDGNFSSGCLAVQVLREDPAIGLVVYDEVAFSVPPDFHAHHDLVATALMTLVGHVRSVQFNFPISRRCADLLTDHYQLEAIGPVEPGLEPRRRGRFIGLSLSGGLDSVASWILLTRAGVEFKVISTDFGERFARERIGYEPFQPDIICRTDLRAKRLDRRGRFIFAAPILFADYLDLAGITHGHNFHHAPPRSIGSLDHGQDPPFVAHERSFTASGVDEVHIVRGLTSLGCAKVVVQGAPERLEAAFHASGQPATFKFFTKGLAVRWLHEQMGRPAPAFLDDLAPPYDPSPFGMRISNDLRALFYVKAFGVEVAELASPGIAAHDLAFLDDLALDFFWKFNTNFVRYLPAGIRNQLLAALLDLGIEPFDERDWRELALLRDFVMATRVPRADRGWPKSRVW